MVPADPRRCVGVFSGDFVVDELYFCFGGGKVVFYALYAAFHLAHHRVARLRFRREEAEVVLIGLELVALDVALAQDALALAVELLLVGADLLYHILET